MKIGYKIRNIPTDKNDWLIAVIYDVDGWPGRSLTHKGLNDYQFKREMTDIELNDFKKEGTRLTWIKYNSLDGFITDEKLCGVDPAFIDKVCNYFTRSQDHKITK